MTTRRRRRSSPWRLGLLVILIGVALYFNQVVVPATPPLFMPTPTPTRSPQAFMQEAAAYFQEGKLAEAAEAYQQAILSDPGNPANYVSLARVQVYLGEYDKAVTNAQNALLKNPNNATAYAIQAWATHFLGDTLAAEGLVKKALELDPNHALAYAVQAEILIDRNDFGEVEKAIEASKLAIQLDPNLMEAYRARGIVLANTQNLPEAVEAFKQAVQLNDRIAELRYNLGSAYRLMGENSLAVDELLSAFALNPRDPDIPTEIMLAYFNEGQYAKAAQFGEDAVKITPTNPRLRGYLGIMYYRNGDLDEAIEQLALAVKGGQDAEGNLVEGLPLDYGKVAEFYYFYGFALAKSNRCAEAVPIFQSLISNLNPDLEPIAVENAIAGLDLCKAGIETPGAGETATPEEGAEGESGVGEGMEGEPTGDASTGLPTEAAAP